MIDIRDFYKVDIRLGKVISAKRRDDFRKPAFVMEIDFGKKLGIKKSSAQITELYSTDDLIGRQVLALTNIPPMQIADIVSECLVLGIEGENGVSLLNVDGEHELGMKVS